MRCVLHPTAVDVVLFLLSHADVLLLHTLCRCRQGVYELLERGLTPQSARRAGDALALICTELALGSQQNGLTPPDLASRRSGLFSKEGSLVKTVSQALGMACSLVSGSLSLGCWFSGCAVMNDRSHVHLLHVWLYVSKQSLKSV